MSRDRVQSALEKLKFARMFTGRFLADIGPEQWFWQPQEGVTHVAWQVGHLAASQYRLCIMRIRERTEADSRLISDDFIERFQIGSQPVSGAENNPPQEEIRRVFDGVHQLALTELAARTDAELDVPVEKPHPVFNTKLGAVQWCSGHELVHAGQIALLRRLMGKSPLR